MCHNIAQAVWDYQGKDLDGVQTAILSRMAWYASWDGLSIYPSIHTLSKQTKFSVSSITRTLKYLKEKRFIIVHKKASKAKHQATHYRFNFERIGMAVPLHASGLYTKSKKAVNNKRNNAQSIPPTVTETIGATVTETIGATVTETNNRLLTKTINKNHTMTNINGPVDNNIAPIGAVLLKNVSNLGNEKDSSYLAIELSQIPKIHFGTIKKLLEYPEYILQDVLRSYKKNIGAVKDPNKYLLGACINRSKQSVG